MTSITRHLGVSPFQPKDRIALVVEPVGRLPGVADVTTLAPNRTVGGSELGFVRIRVAAGTVGAQTAEGGYCLYRGRLYRGRLDCGHLDLWRPDLSTVTVPAAQGDMRAVEPLIKALGGSLGPLTRTACDTSIWSANIIPIAGDSKDGDIAEATLTADIAGTDGTIYVKAGSRLVESFSDGPMTKSSIDAWKIAAPSNLTTAVINLEQPAAGGALDFSSWQHLQDYRDIGPVHGGAAANVLFSDGSV